MIKGVLVIGITVVVVAMNELEFYYKFSLIQNLTESRQIHLTTKCVQISCSGFHFKDVLFAMIVLRYQF